MGPVGLACIAHKWLTHLCAMQATFRLNPRALLPNKD
jgi:hypothetical protein